MQFISQTASMVADYDPAIAWFTTKLGFTLTEDTDMGGDKRWVTIAPDNQAQTQILLARAVTEAQSAAIGNQHGGRIGFFLKVDDFDMTYQAMLGAGVIFRETPRQEAFGKVVVFEDCCGNGWDLLEG
jgi:catechol 2,3-dioxygenase-like lactoylglutathione lyase family enzyme